MIMHRRWLVIKYKSWSRHKLKSERERVIEREGWFLLGFIPLYISTVHVKVFE